MCPNCTRGLTEKKEVCKVCGGTGLANVVEAKVAKPKEEKEVKKHK